MSGLLHKPLPALVAIAVLSGCVTTSQTIETADSSDANSTLAMSQALDNQSDTSVPPPYPLDSMPMTMPFGPSPELLNEAGVITQKFIGTLLPTLQLAMAAGGPLNAIEVCAVQAPAIARQLSDETGWDVSRVSLKTRNSSTATPDNWEEQMLRMFDQRQAAGESAATLNVSEIVNGQFRYMQAQPAAELCLTCHGTNVADDVLAAVRRHYPNDLAIGYSAGQIRGAITLQKPL